MVFLSFLAVALFLCFVVLLVFPFFVGSKEAKTRSHLKDLLVLVFAPVRSTPLRKQELKAWLVTCEIGQYTA